MSFNHIHIEVNSADEDSEERCAPEVNRAEPLCPSEDREFEFLRPDEPRPRSTSVKLVSAPPGTSHPKKVVRFADALGLDLESVRRILNAGDPPSVPSSATRDLDLGGDDRNPSGGGKIRRAEVPCLRAWFSNPSSSPQFRRRVRDARIVLASCDLDAAAMTVGGRIHVANVAYEKRVTVRYTTNAWLTFADLEANYVAGSSDRSTDYFQFAIALGRYFSVGGRLEFSLRLVCNGETYWDSNDGDNYRIECCAAFT